MFTTLWHYIEHVVYLLCISIKSFIYIIRGVFHATVTYCVLLSQTHYYYILTYTNPTKTKEAKETLLFYKICNKGSHSGSLFTKGS